MSGEISVRVMKSIPAKTREKKKEDGYVYIPKDTKEERMDFPSSPVELTLRME